MKTVVRLILSVALLTGLCQAQVIPWVTRSFDNANSGWNDTEKTFTQQTVITKGIRLTTTVPVCCDARGVEAQPLVVPHVKINGAYHDVMLLASMSNNIRAVDYQTGADLWDGFLGRSIDSSAKIDFHQINQHWGALATGVIVIAPSTEIDWYQTAWISEDGSGQPNASAKYHLFRINVTTSGVTDLGSMQGADNSLWKQRSSLLYVATMGKEGTIFFAHGSVYETGGGYNGYTGGITAVDLDSYNIVTMPLTAGIWQAGAKLVTDGRYLYATTGNGDFDPSKGFYGESFIKVLYNPPNGGTAILLRNGVETGERQTFTIQPSLTVVDQWSPWSDYARAGKPLPAMKVAGESLPSEQAKPVGGNMSMSMQDAKVTAVMRDGAVTTYVYPMASGDWSDEDWGSAGPACLFTLNVCVAAGKDGIGYPIRTDKLGATSAATVGTQGNYGALAAPCAWLTVYGPGPCDPVNARDLNVFPNGDTAHMHMTPNSYYDPVLKSWCMFVWGENGQGHIWKVGTTGQLTYVRQTNEYASADVRGQLPGGMPGCFSTVSSNGQNADTYLLWVSCPYNDANARISQGRLLVYDPIHPAADGSIKLLWDSQRFGIPYVYNKFMPPVVDGGELVLPTYAGTVLLFQ